MKKNTPINTNIGPSRAKSSGNGWPGRMPKKKLYHTFIPIAANETTVLNGTSRTVKSISPASSRTQNPA
jgi:hypothetical protein